MSGSNLSSVLSGGANSDIALIDVGDHSVRTFTYGELNALVNKISAGLTARFRGRRFRIGLFARNSTEFIATYFAVMRAGGIVVPFNWRASADSIQYVLDDAAIDLVFSDDRGHLDKPYTAIVFGSTEWLDLLRETASIPADATTDEVAQILYTSGSTGRPKGVPLSHAGQLWAVQEAAKMVPDGPSYRVMVAAPLFHMNALFNVKRSFYTGAAVVLLPGFSAASFLKALLLYRCDWITGVPAMIGLLARHLDGHLPREFHDVRRVFIGSAPYGETLFENVQRLFPKAAIFNAYGTTEAGPTVYGPHPSGLPTPVMSCGYPLFPDMIRLIDENGGEVRSEGTGSLQMRTPATMNGYLNRPEINEVVLKDGWYDSRDIMRQDSNGFHFFVGRADDMFNSGGENIYPAEVEQILEQHPAIEQATVVPIPDEVKFSLPVAFVVTRGHASIDENEIRNWFIARAPAYLHPRRIFPVEEIPLAQTNKVDRSLLKQRARELTALAQQ